LASLPKIPAAARNAVFRSMLKGGLLSEVPAPAEHAGRGWRQDDAGGWIALRITHEGLAAISLDPPPEGPGGAVPSTTPELAHAETNAAAPLDSPPLILEAASGP
jgi:hypothetical protein